MLNAVGISAIVLAVIAGAALLYRKFKNTQNVDKGAESSVKIYENASAYQMDARPAYKEAVVTSFTEPAILSDSDVVYSGTVIEDEDTFVTEAEYTEAPPLEPEFREVTSIFMGNEAPIIDVEIEDESRRGGSYTIVDDTPTSDTTDTSYSSDSGSSSSDD